MSYNKNQDQIKKDRLNNYARFSGIGFQMIAIIGLGVYGGIKLDEKFPNKYQAFTLICSLTSIGVALYNVIRQVNNVSKQNDND